MALTSGQPLTALARLAPAHMNHHLFEQPLEQLIGHRFDGLFRCPASPGHTAPV